MNLLHYFKSQNFILQYRKNQINEILYKFHKSFENGKRLTHTNLRILHQHHQKTTL